MNLKARIGLCYRILRQKPTSLHSHALRELASPTGDDMQALMSAQLMELVHVFSTHGHSGFSAGYARSVLNLLLDYKPVRPLTGEPDEWNEISAGVFQNNRCGRVFKQEGRFDGQAYDIDAVVFREPSGACFTSGNSCRPITFPYTPTTVYVDVDQE